MNSAILRFVTIAYALSAAFGLAIGLTGGHESRWIEMGFLSMLIPTVAACAVRMTMNEPFRIDWERFPTGYIPVALLLMPMVLHATMVPVTRWYEGRLPWLPWLAIGPNGTYETAAPFAWGDISRGALAGHIVANAIFGVIVVSVLAFFEEVGWRGWLLPRVIDRVGVRKGIVVVSILWAFWHVPYVLSGLQQLEGVRPAIAVTIVPVGVAGSGLIIGWLWVRTRSIWIVSLAHGALNSWGQYAFKYMDFVHAPPAVVALAGGFALLLTGGLLLAMQISPHHFRSKSYASRESDLS